MTFARAAAHATNFTAAHGIVQRRLLESEAAGMNTATISVEGGATITIEDGGGKIARCFARGRPYERPLLEHIRAAGFSGLAVDAGANIGNHTLWFALACQLHVAAFEPLQHERLRRNIALNPGAAERIRVEPVGLSDRAGTAGHVGKGRLDPSADHGTLDGAAHPMWADTQVDRIPTRTLDSYDLHDVAFIKIDVEGMEPHVLRGGEQTIRRDRPVIFAEEWGPPEHAAIAAVLEPWGYQSTVRFKSKESATPVARWDPPPARPRQKGPRR